MARSVRNGAGNLKKLVLYGASYFDLIKLIDAINRQQPTWELLGFLDDTPEKKGERYLDVPVLGGLEKISSLVEADVSFFNNVCGHWSRSERIANRLKEHKCSLASLIHPSIDLNYSQVGSSTILPDGCLVGSQSEIGDFVSARMGVLISHDVVVEDHVFIGPGVTIGSGACLKKGCFIGAGATIMLGRIIGEGAVVGAGAVVTKHVPPESTVAGVPATLIK